MIYLFIFGLGAALGWVSIRAGAVPPDGPSQLRPNLKLSPSFSTAVAVFTGCVTTIVFFYFPQPHLLTCFVLFLPLLISLIISDLLYMWVPDRLILFYQALYSVVILSSSMFSPVEAVLGLVLPFILYLLLPPNIRQKIGGGDIKLFATIGLLLGPQYLLLTVFLSCLTGLIWMGVLILLGHLRLNQPVPFVPYIGFSLLLTVLFGDTLYNFYFEYIVNISGLMR